MRYCRGVAFGTQGRQRAGRHGHKSRCCVLRLFLMLKTMPDLSAFSLPPEALPWIGRASHWCPNGL